jgi:hypothetical protein
VSLILVDTGEIPSCTLRAVAHGVITNYLGRLDGLDDFDAVTVEQWLVDVFEDEL